MNVFLTCCLAGAGSDGKKGVLEIGCGRMHDGTVL